MRKLLIIVASFIFMISFACIYGCNTATSDSKLTVTYLIDGETFCTTEEDYDSIISEPELSARKGYVFKGWYISDEFIEKWNFENEKLLDNITLYGYWLPESENYYTVLYYDEGSLIKYEKVIANTKLQNFVPSAKYGYKFSGWLSDNDFFDYNSPVNEDIILSAKWEIVVYSVLFVADDALVKECNYSVENQNISVPSVPLKQHYHGEWEDFELNCNNLIVNAVYVPIIYTATFIVGDDVSEIRYTVEDIFTIPTIPEKTGYNSDWFGLPVTGGNVTLTAIYTPIVYTAYFIAGGEVIESLNFTVENKEITTPYVPERSGFEGIWEEFNLDAEDIYINAKYVIKNYKVTFIADEQIVATEYYNIENLKITTPDIPQKDGFLAVWEDFDLYELKNLTVHAIYSEV